MSLKLPNGDKVTLPKHPKWDMYYAVYPDGTRSKDFYSFTRAKEHTLVLAETERRNSYRDAEQSPAEPHWCV